VRLQVIFDATDSLPALLEEEVSALSRALRTGVDRAATSLQDDLRGQVRTAGLGAGLANAWRKQVYPGSTKRSLHPAALVYSKAVALHDAFDTGALVLPRGGSWLLVPSEAAERFGVTTTTRSRKGGAIPGRARRRLAQLDLAADKLGVPIVSAMPGGARQPRGGSRSAVPRDGFILLTPAGRRGRRLIALYYASRTARPVLLFTLVRQTRVPKRLGIDAAAERAEARFATLVNAALASG
jgi:hypothetical protein